MIDAVQRCWGSLWTARAIGYRLQHDVDQGSVGMGVVVQELVPAEAAGILFTADPVTGNRDLSGISAAWGLGEAVVGGKVSPDTVTVDTVDEHIVSRETSDKQVMVVRVDKGTAERPVPESLREAPVLSDRQAVELARIGERIEQLYGTPMDIEWALFDGAFAIVQARPITALPEPEPDPPAEWRPPNPKGQYMRSSIVDLMPDPLSPLYATMGLSAINRALRRLVEEVFDSPPESIAEDTMQTINGYGYMLASYTPIPKPR